MYYINKIFDINGFDNINKYILNMIPKKYFIDINKEELIEHLKKDKKNEGNNICFIIPEKEGNFNIKFVELNDIKDKLINFII